MTTNLMKRSWRILATLGVLLPASALAQDDCLARCIGFWEAPWCRAVPCNAQDCIQYCKGPKPQQQIIPPPPPCMVEQNAMRPCSPEQQKPSIPAGVVDPGLVGTWELTARNPSGDSRWVWQISKGGTYDFHAEGPGALPAHKGTFAASKGDYTLNSTTINYSDTGTYQLVANDTLSATSSRLGAGTWHRVQSKAAAGNGTSK